MLYYLSYNVAAHAKAMADQFSSPSHQHRTRPSLSDTMYLLLLDANLTSTNLNRAVEAALNETNDELSASLRTSSTKEDDGNPPTQTVERNLSNAEINNDQPPQSSSSTDDEQPGPSNQTHTLPESDPAQPQSSASGAQNPRKRKLDQQSSGQAGPQATTPADVANRQMAQLPLPSNPMKQKFIQKQLLVFLHAYNCSRRMAENPQLKCNLLNCKTYKDVLNHMMNCREGRNCQTPHCVSSRQILGHWKNCTRTDCPVCLPIRQAETIVPQLLNLIQEPGWIPGQVPLGDDWPVVPAVRSHIRFTVIRKIFPFHDLKCIADPRMIMLVEYARTVECNIYDSSNSKMKYARKVAKKIYKIQLEIEEKRQERRQQNEWRLQRQRRQPPPGG